MAVTGATGNNSIPEAPAITVNQTILTLDDATAIFVDDEFDIGDSAGSAGLAFTLSQSPYSNASVSVYKNGSIGGTVDYTLSDTALTLAVALAAGETLHVKYMKSVD